MDFMGIEKFVKYGAIAVVIIGLIINQVCVTYNANWYKNQWKKEQGLHKSNARSNQAIIDSLSSLIERRDGVIIEAMESLKKLEIETNTQLKNLKDKQKTLQIMEYRNRLLEKKFDEILSNFDTAVVNNDTPHLDSLRNVYFPGQSATR
jgi:hypothetical protein